MSNLENSWQKVFQERNVPLIKNGSFESPESGLARMGDDGLIKLSDPNSAVIESDDSEMRHRFVISTMDEDRMGDIIVSRGCLGRIDRYKKNPIVFLNHQSFGLPIAKSESPKGQFALEVRDDKILADAYFHCKTEESEKTYELVKLGYLKGASIGFNPIKGELIRRKKRKGSAEESDDSIDFKSFPGIRFDEWELMEWSVVGIPCNQEALEGCKSWLGKNRKDTAFYTALQAMIPDSKSVTISVPVAPPVEEVSIEFRPIEVPKVLEPVTIAGVEVKPFTDAEIQKALDHLNTKVIEDSEIRIFGLKDIEDLTANFEKKLAEKVAELEAKLAQKMDDLTPPDPSLEVEDAVVPEEPKKTPKLGAAVLQKLLRLLDEAYHLIEAKLPQIENKKTLTFLGELHGCLDETMHSIHKFGGKEYPETFPKSDKAIETESETPLAIEKIAPVPELKAPEPVVSPWTPELLEKFSRAVGDLKSLKQKTDATYYRLTGKKA